MAYTNSPLVNFIRISPNRTPNRNHAIDTITIHHMAGNFTVEECGNGFSKASRQASSNYGIGSDGRVGQYVYESDRAWTSGNEANDQRAITIEVANDGGSPDWHVSDAALAKLIELCVDICKRNGIAKLNYTGDKNGNLTTHNMFQATACPGPYLKSKLSYIATEVNKRLGTGTNTIKVGDAVRITGDTYTNGATVPKTVKNATHVVAQISGDKALLGYPVGIMSWVHLNGLTVVKSASPEPVETKPEPKPTAPPEPTAIDRAIAKGIITAKDNLDASASKRDVVEMLDKLGLLK